MLTHYYLLDRNHRKRAQVQREHMVALATLWRTISSHNWPSWWQLAWYLGYRILPCIK